MRIALVAPLVSIIAQPFTGGSQALLADLAYGLQSRGHEITLFARAGSHLPGITLELIEVPDEVRPATFQQASSDAADASFFVQAHLFLSLFLRLQRQNSAFDLIHAHAFDWPAYTFSTLLKDIPVLHTLHLPALDTVINQALHTLNTQGHPLTLIAVSQNCAQTYASFTSIDAVIYNGLAVDKVPFQADIPADPPLLFVGRISPEKGVETAINIAERAGRTLRIIGSIYNQSYYHQKIAPRIARSAATISYLGPMEREQVWENMGQAAGLLCPVAWDEAFGLTSIEAMACGTPVIAFRRGAMEEVILHGQTGFLAPPDDEKLAAEFAARLPEISRARCRVYVEERFSLEKMISAYEQLYQRCIARSNLPGIS